MANSSPNLTEQSSEQVSPGGTVAVPGSYSDNFAQSNPGMLYLDITDSSGLLSADDTSGNPAAGSGSNTIALSTTYADVNAILGSLQYTAGATSGSDSIRVDVWNQAGVETTGSVPVTITSGGTPTTESWTGAVSGDWNDAANWSGGTVPTSGDTVVIPGSASHAASLSNATLAGETLTVQNNSNASPQLSLTNVTLDSVLEASGIASVQIGGTLTVGAQGTVQAESNSDFTLAGTGETIINDGVIRATGSGVIAIANNASTDAIPATLINHGSLLAVGGSILLQGDQPLPGSPGAWTVQNTGTTTISQGANFDVNGTLNGGTVAFDGAGVLSLERSNAFAGGATVSGFGEGDEIRLLGGAENGTLTAVSNGTLQVGSGGSIEAIPLSGSYSLGNFENSVLAGGGGEESVLAYAPNGGPSGQVVPDVVAPASDSVEQGATLDLGDVSIQYPSNVTSTNLTLGISAASGTLFMNGATGSGTSHLSLGVTSLSQVNADLSSLTYVPAAGGSSDTVSVTAVPSGQAHTTRSIPITITRTSSGGPALNEPSSETVPSGGSVAVSGSYSDSFAAGNPGAMYLHIGDGSGTLSATNASGTLVAGSGSNSITLSTDYADVNAVLQSLTYVAGAAGGSDTISFDLWNQAGTETTGSVPVTIGGGSGPGTETWTGAVSSDWNNAGNWSGGAVPTSGDTVLIPGNTPNTASLSNAVLSGETITLQQTGGTLLPAVNFTNVTLDSTLSASGQAQVNIGGTLTVGTHGTVLAGTGNDIGLAGTAETVINNGLLESAGGGLDFYNAPAGSNAAATLINNGSIVANGGGIGLISTSYLPGAPPQWDVLNSGSVAIGNGGALTLNGTLNGGAVSFNGAGGLGLEQPQALVGGATISGFGQGDSLDFYGPAKDTVSGFNNGTLQIGTGGSIESIVLNGSYTLGNFEDEMVGGAGNPSQVAYAPGNGASGQVSPEVIAPASDSVAQGGTLSLGNVSVSEGGTSGNVTLGIDAGSGTLYMNGASGNGTSHLSLGLTPLTQANADLSSLTYVPAAGNTADTVSVSVNASGVAYTERWIPISIGSGGGGSGPALNEPSSENVATNGTVAVSGSYSDSFAQGNPGKLWLGITDSSGTLSSTDASGAAVAGSGSNSIGLSTDYVDLNAILSNLHYTAGGSAGSDTIHFDVWNQAGVETTAATAVTIGSMAGAMQQASNAMMTNFAAPSSGGSGTLVPDNTASVGSSSAMLANVGQQPTGIPLTLHG